MSGKRVQQSSGFVGAALSARPALKKYKIAQAVSLAFITTITFIHTLTSLMPFIPIDCVDLLCDIKSYCSEGMAIAVTDCSPYQWSDKSASFSVVTDNHGLFDTSLKGDQIQVHDTNLCLSQSGDRAISLQNCNSSKIEQRFVGFTSGGGGAMELTPANSTANDKCLTQHHHPRVGERICVEDCKKARRSDTNLWDLWLAY